MAEQPEISQEDPRKETKSPAEIIVILGTPESCVHVQDHALLGAAREGGCGLPVSDEI